MLNLTKSTPLAPLAELTIKLQHLFRSPEKEKQLDQTRILSRASLRPQDRNQENEKGGAVEKRIQLLRQLVRQTLDQKDWKKTVGYLSYLGVLYKQEGNLSLAAAYHRKSIQLIIRLKDLDGLKTELLYLTDIYYELKEWFQLVHSSKKLLEIAQLGKVEITILPEFYVRLAEGYIGLIKQKLEQEASKENQLAPLLDAWELSRQRKRDAESRLIFKQLEKLMRRRKSYSEAHLNEYIEEAKDAYEKSIELYRSLDNLSAETELIDCLGNLYLWQRELNSYFIGKEKEGKIETVNHLLVATYQRLTESRWLKLEQATVAYQKRVNLLQIKLSEIKVNKENWIQFSAQYEKKIKEIKQLRRWYEVHLSSLWSGLETAVRYANEYAQYNQLAEPTANWAEREKRKWEELKKIGATSLTQLNHSERLSLLALSRGFLYSTLPNRGERALFYLNQLNQLQKEHPNILINVTELAGLRAMAQLMIDSLSETDDLSQEAAQSFISATANRSD